MLKMTGELLGYEMYQKSGIEAVPVSEAAQHLIKQKINLLMHEQSKNNYSTLAWGLLPLFILAVIWLAMIFTLLPFMAQNIESKIILSLVFGIIHGAWGYSFVIYTLHEGGGHQNIIPRHFKRLGFINQASRLMFADPLFYAGNHHTHHRDTGTHADQTFTQFILPKRFFLSIIPGSGVLWWNEFQVHVGKTWTASKIKSHLIGAMFLSLEIALTYPILGAYAFLALLFIGPWSGLVLDRMREAFEHNLSPFQHEWGAKDMRAGSVMGMLVAGGPWGQVFHLSHHLAPMLKWHNQWRLHYFLRTLLKGHKNYFDFFPLEKNIFIKYLATLLIKNSSLLELIQNKDEKGIYAHRKHV